MKYAIIYKIICDCCSKVYVGKTTKSLKKRLNDHIRKANSPEGNTRKLQTHIREKNNITLFKIYTICEGNFVDDDHIAQMEDYYIQMYDSIDNGYNCIRASRRTKYQNIMPYTPIAEQMRQSEIEAEKEQERLRESIRQQELLAEQLRNIMIKNGLDTTEFDRIDFEDWWNSDSTETKLMEDSQSGDRTHTLPPEQVVKEIGEMLIELESLLTRPKNTLDILDPNNDNNQEYSIDEGGSIEVDNENDTTQWFDDGQSTGVHSDVTLSQRVDIGPDSLHRASMEVNQEELTKIVGTDHVETSALTPNVMENMKYTMIRSRL